MRVENLLDHPHGLLNGRVLKARYAVAAISANKTAARAILFVIAKDLRCGLSSNQTAFLMMLNQNKPSVVKLFHESPVTLPKDIRRKATAPSKKRYRTRPGIPASR